MDVLSVRVPVRQPPRAPLFRGGQGQEPAPVSPAASEEYYQLLVSSESHGCGADVPSYTVGEIERATSEFIVKNAVSVPRRGGLPPPARGPRPSIHPAELAARWLRQQSVDFQEATSFLKKKKSEVGGPGAESWLRHLPFPATPPSPGLCISCPVFGSTTSP